MFPSDSQSDEDRDRQQHPLQVPDKRLVCVCVWQKVNELAFSVSAESAFPSFTFIHLADAFIQSDFQERALQKCIGHWS